eukprot:6838189-Ditylum_brightwellii.AAC.1
MTDNIWGKRSLDLDDYTNAIADWFILGLHTGFQLDEWAQYDRMKNRKINYTRAIDGSPKVVILMDFVFKGQ